MQNLGRWLAKKTFLRSVGLKLDEKQAVTFALFSSFMNPQRATLTYSALVGGIIRKIPRTSISCPCLLSQQAF